MKLDHIVIMVSDLARSLAYYEALLPLLGFSKQRDHVFGNSDGVSIDIRQADDLGQPYKRFAPGLNHIGFTAPDRQAIVLIRTLMKERGHEIPPIQEFGNGIAVFFKDPDGMRVEISTYG